MRKLFTLLFLTATIATLAQTCPEGQTALQNQHYEKALTAFSECLKKVPRDSSLVFITGYLQLKVKSFKKAIPLLEQSISLNYQPVSTTQYLLGYCYAASGESEKSLYWLQEAAAAGFSVFPQLDSIQFDSFRKTEAFSKVRKDIYENAFPCLKDKNNNKFDFWLGEWDVYVNNNKIADSRISKATGGCAVHEDYVVLSGVYAGQSISFYDPADQRWEQYWVGSAGDKSEYFETDNYEQDMQFIWKRKNPKGTEVWTKMSYVTTDENTVIQTLVSSTDEGATWNPSFTGTYKRKP